MKHRILDKNGAPVYGRGLSSYANGDDATVLNVVTRLKSYEGDCFFDLKANIDWNNILGSKSTLPKGRVDEDVKRAVLESENVASIASFTSSLLDRKYSATIEIVTKNNTSITFGVEVEA